MQKTEKKFNPDWLHLETIIAQRLNLSCNQRQLWSEFGISFANLSKIKNPDYLKLNYKNWPQEKKNQFILLVGGRTNFKKTENYLNHLTAI